MSSTQSAYERGMEKGFNKTLNTIQQNHIPTADVLAALEQLLDMPTPRGEYSAGVQAGTRKALTQIINNNALGVN